MTSSRSDASVVSPTDLVELFGEERRDGAGTQSALRKAAAEFVERHGSHPEFFNRVDATAAALADRLQVDTAAVLRAIREEYNTRAGEVSFWLGGDWSAATADELVDAIRRMPPHDPETRKVYMRAAVRDGRLDLTAATECVCRLAEEGKKA